MPAAALGFQGLITGNGTFSASPAYRQLHGQHGHAHNNQKQQIKQDKHTAAIGAGDIREFPHVSDSDGTARTYQQKAQTGLKVLSLQTIHLLFRQKTEGIFSC